jgi:hypothetical protein
MAESFLGSRRGGQIRGQSGRGKPAGRGLTDHFSCGCDYLLGGRDDFAGGFEDCRDLLLGERHKPKLAILNLTFKLATSAGWSYPAYPSSSVTLERAGVPRSVAMKLIGHKTEAMYRRYAIVSPRDLTEGVAKLALLRGSAGNSERVVLPFGHNDGHNRTEERRKVAAIGTA